MPELGAVVVSWNSAADIGRCLDALLAQGVREIVVVDNASRDRTWEEVRRRGVRLIANPWNRGFAAAANQGIAALNQPLALLANPDTEVLEGLEALVEACRPPDVAAAGGKLVDERGRPQAGFMVRRFPTPVSLALEMLGINRVWPGNPINRRYRALDLDPDRPAEVEQPAGAFLAIRREAWRRLGGLDEAFHPLWFEDVDWLRRARQAGYRILYEPRAVARHRGAGSVAALSWEQRRLYWYDSLLRYAARHFSPAWYGLVGAAALLAGAMRATGDTFGVGGKALRVYGRIVRLAVRRLVHARREGERLTLGMTRP
jgi:N-acetylglucosaminyl-diphospho-decaprenol L-rhamnosyltransferase